MPPGSSGRSARRPLLSRLHASQSVGLVAGALLATAAAAAGLPLPAHFGKVAAAGAVCGLAATACLPGLALLAPAILGAAPQAAAGIPPGTAIAAVTTAGYLGSFTGPPLIGALAGLLTLSGAIGLVAVAAATAVLLAPTALPSRPPRRAPRSP